MNHLNRRSDEKVTSKIRRGCEIGESAFQGTRPFSRPFWGKWPFSRPFTFWMCTTPLQTSSILQPSFLHALGTSRGTFRGTFGSTFWSLFDPQPCQVHGHVVGEALLEIYQLHCLLLKTWFLIKSSSNLQFTFLKPWNHIISN